ncbi:MAG: thioredoxin-dependent thiol peroxidase [Phycisphaeraceae bacterium]|nr:thioredoxin-dependent thiol peroxidase [Phycisphaeraceae bacterium]
MPVVEVGDRAPAFTLRDQSGAKRTLAEFRGGPVVIYFYPEDDTPLCTTQACGLSDVHAEMRKLGAGVIGISPDTVESHAAFAGKYALPFTLLADVPDAKGTPRVCAKYGVWGEKNMYGKTMIGMLRTTYLIDERGRVARRWDRVKTPGHAERVLKAVRELGREG